MRIDLDKDIINKELIELQQESQEHNNTPSYLQCFHLINTQNLMAININHRSNNDESDFYPSLGSDDNFEVESLYLVYIFYYYR